jgi:ribonuclease P protein component
MLVAPARASDEGGGSRPARRIGITASRKVGGAVVRNRIKRRVREWFRQSRDRLPPDVDVVVIARPGAGALSSQELYERLSGLAVEARRG